MLRDGNVPGTRTSLLEKGWEYTQCQQASLSNHLVGETGVETVMGHDGQDHTLTTYLFPSI